MKRFFFFLLAVAAPAAAQTALRDIVLANGGIELRFDRSTGQWRDLRMLSGSAVLDGAEPHDSLLIAHGGKTVDPPRRMDLWSIRDLETRGAGVRLAGHRIAKSGTSTTLTLEQKEGSWDIEQQFSLDAAGTVERRVKVTWSGPDPVLLRWIDLRTPSEPAAEGTVLEAPGYPRTLHQPLADLPMGQWRTPEDSPNVEVPDRRIGLFLTRTAQRSLLVWPFDREIATVVSVHRGPNGMWLNHRLFASSRLRKGESISAGTQYLRVAGPDVRRALGEFQGFWRRVGMVPVFRAPDWASTATIYEVHLGRSGGVDPYPDIDALTRDLPRIRKMGFDVIQVMPRHPYPSYSVHDYRDIETQYAPPAGLKEMVRQAHSIGLKVILDVILHGVADPGARVPGGTPTHPWTREHPDWFSRTDEGGLARTYTWAFDHASPGYQNFMVEVFCDYIRQLDIDGYRVDAATWNFFPNWAENLDRPGYKSIHASAELMNRIRRETARIKRELLYVTESNGPLFRTSFDLVYNWDELWMYGALLPVRPGTKPRGGTKPQISARYMAEWMDLRRLASPPGLAIVHQADSHDTKAPANFFHREVFGEAGARLIFAWFAFLDGSVMNVVEAEKGMEDQYRVILDLRRRHRALESPDVDYRGAEPSSDRVLAPIRRSGAEWALPVLSFSDAPVKTTLNLGKLALQPAARYTLREAFTGEIRTGTGKELSTMTLELPAYAVQLWTLAK